MRNTSNIKAVISNKIRKSQFIGMGIYIAIIVLIAIIVPCSFYSRYRVSRYPTCLIVTIFLAVFLISLIPIYVALQRRKRRLTELTVTDKELFGYYTALIPFAKISLRMPIEKIDNVSAVNSVFLFFTGKLVIINSTSGSFKIPYVLNADEIVEFISTAIENRRNGNASYSATNFEQSQDNAADTLKKIADLRDAGIITEEEFEQKKREILGKM